MDDLAYFLVKAKINTYASNGETGEALLKDGCKELKYEENKFTYRDIYFGSNPFLGEEIVWKDKKVIWGMNYYGEATEKIVPTESVYNFLKEALKKVNSKKPFRGPDSFKKENFEYNNKVSGTVQNFKGKEIILYKGKKVYEAHYHGGLING